MQSAYSSLGKSGNWLMAFGTVLESAYGIGHEKYIDYQMALTKDSWNILSAASSYKCLFLSLE